MTDIDEATMREQARHDEARRHLARMREKTERAKGAAGAATDVDSEIMEWTLAHRLRSLTDDPSGVFFGSIDDGRDEFYVGRRHIEAERGEAFVIDWRAPAATPFYRATWADPMELHTRRRHTIEDHTVVALFEENFDDEDSVGGGGVPDPLLAELERARSGSMRDIVATIQQEQDEVIRAPLESTIVVQGGPGTGKTAVGLHRAAFLLYEHRELLDREGVLVVGPNQRFLRYIAQVLPSLGEHAVTQLTVDGVASTRRFPKGADSGEVQRVKGSAAMVEVIGRLVTSAISPTDVAAPLGHRMIRLTSEEVGRVIHATLTGSKQINSAREGFVQQAASFALRKRHERHSDEIERLDELRDQLRKSSEWNKALDKIWPSQSAPALLRRFYGNGPTRRAVTEGFLSDGEREQLARRGAKRVSDEPWTASDLVLLDEIEDRLNGTPTRFGHIVVDEAQDLTAMGLRMIRRRADRSSMTVLGDLAQSTKPGGQTSWDEALDHLGRTGAQLVELELGYRLPASILDYASHLLAEAAPGLRPSRSVREGGLDPVVVAVSHEDLFTAAAERASQLADLHTTVAILAANDHVAAAEAAVIEAGHDLTGLEPAITVIEASIAKGLEFDAVIVIEPSAIATSPAHYDRTVGLRVLYVALTRAVQELHILHSEPLPAALHGTH